MRERGESAEGDRLQYILYEADGDSKQDVCREREREGLVCDVQDRDGDRRENRYP